MSHTVPKRDPKALSRGCGAHRYRAGGSGGVAKLPRRELRTLWRICALAEYPGRQRDAQAGMALEMPMWGGGTHLFPVPCSEPERCAEGAGADPAEGRLPALEPAARYAGTACPVLRDSPGAETPVPAAL